MQSPPLWFSTAVFLELLFQLPFFFFAVHAFYHGLQHIRIPSIIYATHVATTVAIILPPLYVDCTNESEVMRVMLVALYSIYLIIPIALLYRMCASEQPFEESSSSAQKQTKKKK